MAPSRLSPQNTYFRNMSLGSPIAITIIATVAFLALAQINNFPLGMTIAFDASIVGLAILGILLQRKSSTKLSKISHFAMNSSTKQTISQIKSESSKKSEMCVLTRLASTQHYSIVIYKYADLRDFCALQAIKGLPRLNPYEFLCFDPSLITQILLKNQQNLIFPPTWQKALIDVGLTHLELNQVNFFNGPPLSALSSKISSLKLRACSINEAGFTRISSTPTITEIELSFDPFDIDSLKPLFENPHLKILKLTSDTTGLTGLTHSLTLDPTLCPNLTELHINTMCLDYEKLTLPASVNKIVLNGAPMHPLHIQRFFCERLPALANLTLSEGLYSADFFRNLHAFPIKHLMLGTILTLENIKALFDNPNLTHICLKLRLPIDILPDQIPDLQKAIDLLKHPKFIYLHVLWRASKLFELGYPSGIFTPESKSIFIHFMEELSEKVMQISSWRSEIFSSDIVTILKRKTLACSKFSYINDKEYTQPLTLSISPLLNCLPMLTHLNLKGIHISEPFPLTKNLQFLSLEATSFSSIFLEDLAINAPSTLSKLILQSKEDVEYTASDLNRIFKSKMRLKMLVLVNMKVEISTLLTLTTSQRALTHLRISEHGKQKISTKDGAILRTLPILKGLSFLDSSETFVPFWTNDHLVI